MPTKIETLTKKIKAYDAPMRDRDRPVSHADACLAVATALFLKGRKVSTFTRMFFPTFGDLLKTFQLLRECFSREMVIFLKVLAI